MKILGLVLVGFVTACAVDAEEAILFQSLENEQALFSTEQVLCAGDEAECPITDKPISWCIGPVEGGPNWGTCYCCSVPGSSCCICSTAGAICI